MMKLLSKMINFYDENDKVYSGFQFNTRYAWENGTKKASNSRFQIQIRGSNILRFI